MNIATLDQGPREDSNAGRSVVDQVISDLQARREMGIERYGGELVSHNGRLALVDAYQEILDFVLYFRQYLMEVEDGRSNTNDSSSIRRVHGEQTCCACHGAGPKTTRSGNGILADNYAFSEAWINEGPG